MTVESGRLDRASHRKVGVLKGQSIFQQNQNAEAVYRLERGCVRLQLHSEDGHREVIAFLFPGDVFSAGLQTHWASADAVTDTIVTRFSKNSLWQLMGAEPEAAMTLLFSADELLTELARHIGRLSHASASDRLTWFLGWVADRSCAVGSGPFHLPMSRRDIADFLGIAPETVSRLLRQLEASGELRRIDLHSYVYRPRRDRLQ
jgi:CRP-like cAMP-binding protein